MARTNTAYTVTGLGTATATGTEFHIPSNERLASRYVQFIITGTATVKLMGRLTPGGTAFLVGTAATTTGAQAVLLPPYCYIDVSGASAGPNITVMVDAQLTS